MNVNLKMIFSWMNNYLKVFKYYKDNDFIMMIMGVIVKNITNFMVICKTI